MELTNIITIDNPASQFIIIVDKDGNPLKHIKSYNIDTGEAEIYRVEYSSKLCLKCKLDINKQPIVDKVILEGSKIRFMKNDNYKEIKFK